jgi:hypothetical protein
MTPSKKSAAVRAAQFAGVAVAVAGLVFAVQPHPLAARGAADPTFAEDVAPILYKNCTTCHRPGGLGPFSLLDYDSAKANVDEIKEKVSARVMPPWHADGPKGVFRNDRRLSESERGTILRWIDAGAKPGDLKKLPAKPTYPNQWTIGTPDAVVGMSEDFEVPAQGTVEYMYFTVPTNFTEEKWVSAIEIMPGAREVVHHVLVFARVPAPPAAAQPPATQPPAARPAGTPAPAPLFVRRRDQALPPDSPRQDTLHAPRGPLGALIATTAPGTNVLEFPKGTALRVRPGTVLTFQMHYTAHGHAMKDRTTVGFKFASEMPDEEIFASQFTNGSFTIPAGAKDVAVPAEITAGQPVRIWGMMPHTHLRGTRWQYKLVNPDSSSQIILDVPRYDFNWQTYYMFDKPLEMQPGQKIVSMAWYDNSASNKSNPDASKDVKWGDQTWEEMQYTGFLYTVPSRRLRPPPGDK